jgi:endonuclease/exonuclease/phosphatase family metal-dependent hydrolase
MRPGRIAIIVALAGACSGTASVISAQTDSTCMARGGASIRWVRTAPEDERAAVDRWCSVVGPPARMTALRGPAFFTGSFVVVSWNTHVGAGDLDAFVADLRAGKLTAGTPVQQFVLLLQEVYRSGADVPARGPGAAWASAQQPARPSGSREDIVAAARRLDLNAIYVPSMRNGAPGGTTEDRGNAILSTVPLAEVTAIELPLERQRRVSLSGVIHLRSGSRDVALTVVDTHFTNMVGHHLWLFSEAGRTRQAVALRQVLPASGPLIVGGDFNAWFGFRDAAYKELAKIAAPPQTLDRRASFGPMRLDHVLLRLPQGWNTTLRRADHRYGSDHYPLVTSVEVK